MQITEHLLCVSVTLYRVTKNIKKSIWLKNYFILRRTFFCESIWQKHTKRVVKAIKKYFPLRGLMILIYNFHNTKLLSSFHISVLFMSFSQTWRRTHFQKVLLVTMSIWYLQILNLWSICKPWSTDLSLFSKEEGHTCILDTFLDRLWTE